MYKVLVVVSCILSVVFAAGCSRNLSKKKEPLEKLRIGIQANTITAIVLVAEGREFFEEQGLDVTIIKYPSGKLALQGLFNDEVDLATAADLPVMSSSFTRDDYSIICTIAYTDNGAWILARNDHGIDNAFGLRGKKIGSYRYARESISGRL